MSIIAIGGFFFAKAKKCGEVEQKYLSNLLLFLIMPCVMIHALDIKFDRGKFIQLASVILFFLLAQIIFVIIATAFNHPKTELQKQRHSSNMMAIVFPNVGFMGIPLINAMYGAEGVFIMTGCNLTFNVFLWTYGIFNVTHRISVRQVLTNPAVISVIAALIIFVSPFSLPKVVSQSLNFIGQLNTATTMLLLGMLFATYHSSENSKNIKAALRGFFGVAKIVIVRLVIAPAVLLLVFWLGKNFLSFIPNLKQVMTILIVAGACPIGMNVANFAVLYNPKNQSYSSLLVLVSSVLCVFTIPIIVRIAEIIL